MSLIVCPDCKKEVSDQAPACPSCGRVISATPTPPREGCFLRTMNVGCVVVLVIIAIAVAIGGYVIYSVVSVVTEDPKPTQSQYSTPQAKPKETAPRNDFKPIRMVIAGTAEIFEQPSTDRNLRIGMIQAGKYLIVVDKSGQFYKSEFKEGGYFWIHEGYLKPVP